MQQKVILYGDDTELLEIIGRRVFKERWKGELSASDIVLNDDISAGYYTRGAMQGEQLMSIYIGAPSEPYDYNLVIDSENKDVLCSEIAKQCQRYAKGAFDHIIKIDPVKIYPTQHIRDFSVNVIDEYKTALQNNPEQIYQITGNVLENNWYVFDGHHRLAAEIQNNSSLIELKECRTGYSPMEKSDFYDFEDLCGFRYDHYPEPVTLDREPAELFRNEEIAI